MREDKLRKIIREELANFLIREIEVQKASRPGEGEQREGTVHEKIETNVLDWFCSYLPYIEGALRGMQQDLEKSNNKITGQLAPAIEAISKILIENEKNITEVAKLAKKLKPILEIEFESNPQRRLDNKTLG